LPRKTSVQAELTSAEQVQSFRAPETAPPFWETRQKQLDELHIALVPVEE